MRLLVDCEGAWRAELHLAHVALKGKLALVYLIMDVEVLFLLEGFRADFAFVLGRRCCDYVRADVRF